MWVVVTVHLRREDIAGFQRMEEWVRQSSEALAAKADTVCLTYGHA